jgi:DNA polymerase V
MIDAAICDGDIAVIDRSVDADDGDVVVAYIDKEYTVKYLDLTHRREGWIELRPANEHFRPIRIDEGSNFRVWGVVVYTIKAWK